MSSRKQWLIAKVVSEGYCCLNAYLRLCRARGESVENMAKNIGMSPDAIWYHYRKLDALVPGNQCQKWHECMEAIVAEIEHDKKPSEEG